MENNEKKRADDLKDVLVGLSSDDSTVVISESDKDGRLEFRFETPRKSGLVFEESDTVDFGAVSESAPSEPSAPSAEVKPVEPAFDSKADIPVTTGSGVASEPMKEEFSIPERFDAEKESATVDENNRVWSTYVPRFTEISETYRMSDDPRPRPEKTEKRIVADGAASDEDMDPTDESLDHTDDVETVVVNLTQKTEEAQEQSFSIYKFSSSEPAPATTTDAPERTVEDEREEIATLFSRREQKPEEPEQTPDESETESANQPKKYRLPDPERDENVHVVDFIDTEGGERNVAEAPDGANDDSVAFGKKKSNPEFTANLQRDVFKDRFLDSIMSVKIRLIAALVITFAMLIFENIGLFGVDIVATIGMGAIPGAMAIADMQFALCVFILAMPEICSAFKKLAHGSVAPELSLVLSAAVLGGYTVVIVFENSPANNDYPLFGILLALQGLAAVFGTCCKRTADFAAFKRISAGGEKKVLDKKLTRTLERENLALDGAVDETKSKTARIFKTTFVSDFFKRTSISVEESRDNTIILAVALLSAFVGAIIAFFIGGGWVSAATTFAAIALLTMPAATILVHKLPYYHASNKCESEDSSIIGEGSIYDYSGVDVIAFEDVDIFGAEDVNLKRIIHYGDVDNMMKAMRQMSAVFSNIGGPLGNIFDNALDRKPSPATRTVIDRDGVYGRVDGHDVCAGTAEYMLRHGIELPLDAESSRAGVSDSTKVMYGAEDGVIYVQFHIRYTFSEEFTMLLPTLKKEKIVPLIYTRDPNISDELMKTLTGGDDCIRIMKRNTTNVDDDRIYRRVSAGVVTSGDKLDVIGVILLAKNYVRLMKDLSKAEIVVMALGCFLASALAIAGAVGPGSLVSLTWQIIWGVALYIVSRISFGVKKKEEDSDDE